MSAYQNRFKRYELKYLITRAQCERLKRLMEPYITGDSFGRSTVCNIYFDTPSYLLIRRSIDRPVYKEKLRLRSYGLCSPESPAFLELKKKYESVVYKRRASMTEQEAEEFLLRGDSAAPDSPAEKQVLREIRYTMEHYENLQPAVFLSYNREAFFCIGDRDVRITFDDNILWRDYDLSLCSGIYGAPILSRNQVLMEIKTAAAIPLWLAELLSKEQIYKTSFSKYGSAYKAIFNRQQRKDDQYA